MGVCQSGEAEAGGDAWEENQEMNDEINQGGMRANKMAQEGEVGEFNDDNRPEDDFFEFQVEEVGEGQEFMAVKPWKGQIAEPDDHPEPDPSQPDTTYALEYVYGYRCQDSRQNVYFNPDSNVTYMTACLGVILNKEENTQTFFGGGEVENKSKQVASDKNHHNNDIMCMNVNTAGDRQWAVTGQVGKSASVFVWNTQTAEKKARFKLPRNSRAVAACAISPDGEYIGVADKSNDHMVTMFKVGDGSQCFTTKGGPDPIIDMAFTKQAGVYQMWSAGTKHFAMWDIADGKMRKGLFGGVGKQTSMACVTADDQGIAYSGGSNSLIYVWNGRQLKETIGVHEAGFVGALNWLEGRLYSGGRDGRINIIDTANGNAVIQTFQMGVLPRAIDVFGGKLVTGLMSGSIVEIDLESGDQRTLMESHNQGEVWGLDMTDSHVFTSGDDNQVKQWDPFARNCVQTAIVNEKERKAKKNRASTLGKMAESQASRAVAVAPSSVGHIAVGANDGSVTIRTMDDMNTIANELQDNGQWIETMEYSPDGAYLAVGSHDTNIYLYETVGYTLAAKCKEHNAAVTSIDWSADGTYIKSVCNAYELLYFNMPDGVQDKSGKSNTTGTLWKSGHAKFGWLVDGIFPKGTDGTHINGVDFNHDQTLIACGDDYGLVQLFRNPCRIGHAPRSLRGHSEHVVRVKFGRDGLGEYLFSVGGYDQSLMQWKIVA